jgi:hypothetical protein
MSVCCECCVLSGSLSALGWSLSQRRPTECVVSEYDREVSVMRSLWLIRGLLCHGGEIFVFISVNLTTFPGSKFPYCSVTTRRINLEGNGRN